MHQSSATAAAMFQTSMANNAVVGSSTNANVPSTFDIDLAS